MSSTHGHNTLNSEEVQTAQKVAMRGAGWGALKWGTGMALIAGVAHLRSPVYRGLTIQFKIYIQMAGMMVGSWIEGERAVEVYRSDVMLQRRLAHDRAIWATLEREAAEFGGPPPPPRPKHLAEPESS